MRSCGRAGGGPCVKRNVIGAMDALSAAQMALAGIESRVPPDQVLDAMAEVGRSLPPSPGDGKGRPGRNALWDGVRTQGGVI